MKRVYFLAMCALLSIGIFTGCSEDDESINEDEIVDVATSKFKFSVLNDNEVEVKGVVKGMTKGVSDMVIPEKIRIGEDVYTVTSIGRYVFDDYESKVKTVVLPNTIKSIGEDAFTYCFEMTSINIPSGVTSIGADAFEGCESLKRIIIPSSVKSIGYLAFAGCFNADIIVENNVSDVDFYDWDDLKVTLYQIFTDCKSVKFNDKTVKNVTDTSK